MAKSRKKTKPVKTAVRLKNIVVLRGTEEWKAWLDRLAEENSAPITVTIEQALKEFGEKLGVGKPPRRTS